MSHPIRPATLLIAVAITFTVIALWLGLVTDVATSAQDETPLWTSPTREDARPVVTEDNQNVATQESAVEAPPKTARPGVMDRAAAPPPRGAALEHSTGPRAPQGTAGWPTRRPPSVPPSNSAAAVLERWKIQSKLRQDGRGRPRSLLEEPSVRPRSLHSTPKRTLGITTSQAPRGIGSNVFPARLHGAPLGDARLDGKTVVTSSPHARPRGGERRGGEEIETARARYIRVVTPAPVKAGMFASPRAGTASAPPDRNSRKLPDAQATAETARPSRPPRPPRTPRPSRPPRPSRAPARSERTPSPDTVPELRDVDPRFHNTTTGACLPRHAADHHLVNTKRPALVVYTVTSLADKQARQVEIDNLRFFKEHGMFPPNEPTALFSSVDFAIMTINLNRPSASGQHGVLECDGGAANVRVFEAPSGPCDLCAEARLVDALGGADHVARSYEFVAVLNSGVRGPFFTEAPAAPGGKPPVTWIDHFALGGEKVYTGAIMTGSDGAADGKRPFLFSFSFNFPASLLPALYPVLLAGCSEKPLPPLWIEWIRAYETNLHDPSTDFLTAPQMRAVLKKTLSNPSTITSKAKGNRNRAAKLFDEKVAEGVKHRLDLTRAVDESLASGGHQSAHSDRKFRCVIRSETQLLKSALEAKLPPEEKVTRPKLSPAQAALLSPALSGYLHEGHFFLHTWKQNQTMVNMGHASVALFRTPDELRKSVHGVSPCSVIIAKFGGGAWRGREVPHSTIEDMQALSLVHVPRYHAPSPASLGRALRCKNPRVVGTKQHNSASTGHP